MSISECGEPPPTDDGLIAVIRSHARDSPERETACRELVTRYRWMVVACAQRYRASPEAIEDLTQVGYVGLLTAISHYDPARGDSFGAYARPCVSGEIKRYFRDKRWPVHVERSVQEMRLAMRTAVADLTQTLQRIPTEAEVAQFLNISPESLARARLADLSFQMTSLDVVITAGDGDGPGDLADQLGTPDARLEQLIELVTVIKHWPELTPIQQQVLLLRFYRDMKQSDIGMQLGVSQVQVSRLQSRAISHLRTAILSDTA